MAFARHEQIRFILEALVRIAFDEGLADGGQRMDRSDEMSGVAMEVQFRLEAIRSDELFRLHGEVRSAHLANPNDFARTDLLE